MSFYINFPHRQLYFSIQQSTALFHAIFFPGELKSRYTGLKILSNFSHFSEGESDTRHTSAKQLLN